MTAVLMTPPFLQFLDGDGEPLAGGWVYTYAAGTDTPKATYTTQAASVAMDNPVHLDSSGRPVLGNGSIWINGSYKIVVKDALFNTIKTTDNVTSFTTLAEAASAYFQSFSGDGTTTVFTTSDSLGTEEKGLMVFINKGLQSCVTNGTFASDTGWTKGAGWTITAGTGVATGAISTAISQTSPVTIVQGQAYSLTYTITRSAGGLIPSIGGTSGTERTASGTYREVIIAGSSQTTAFTGNAFTGTLDDVVISAATTAGFDIQNPSAYTISGTSLTFATAPATGTNNIFVFAPSLLLGAASAAAAQAIASAAAALTSETNAATSATNAATSASSASTSASSASTSASSASTSASTATTQASNASTSASSASTSATNASNSASTATTQASNASTSATNAATSATSAATSATSAAAFAVANLKWLFDSSTSMADPGTGDLRLNNATIASVTAIAISETNSDAADMTAYIATFDDSTHSNRGYLTIRKNATNFAVFSISGASTDNTGWFQLAVTYLSGAGTFSNTDPLYIGFALSGDDGASTVSDAAYGVGWDGVTTIAPSKNATYDKIETLVTGPASATDNAIVRFDATTGKLIQNSAVTIADTSGNMAGLGTLNTHTLPGGTDTIALLAASQALTNKTIVAGSNTISGITEAMQTLADNTTNNASTSNHGYLKKLSNTATEFMNGVGNWATPGGMPTATVTQFTAATTLVLTVDFTTYGSYEFLVFGATNGSFDDNLGMTVSSDGGSGYATTTYYQTRTVATTNTNQTTGLGFMTTGAITFSSQIKLFQRATTSTAHFVNTSGDVSGTGVNTQYGTGSCNTSAAINRVKFTAVNGNNFATTGYVIYYPTALR